MVVDLGLGRCMELHTRGHWGTGGIPETLKFRV